MTRDDVIQLLGWRLGDRSDMASRIQMEMKVAQQNVLEGNRWLPWFLSAESVGTTGLTGTLAVPTDFLAEMEEGHLYITVEGQDLRLVKKDYDEAKSLTAGSDAGHPEYYAVVGDVVHFFPTPDQDYPYVWQYYASAPDMTAVTGETPWLKYAADLVMAVVGEQLAAKHIQNPEMAMQFRQDIAPAWDRLYTQHIARQEINQLRSLGGNS